MTPRPTPIAALAVGTLLAGCELIAGIHERTLQPGAALPTSASGTSSAATGSSSSGAGGATATGASATNATGTATTSTATTTASSSGSGGMGIGKWPDSPTVTCSDTTKIGSCPKPGDLTYGQDGNYLVMVPKYTTTAETVLDSVTGLKWQRNPPKALKVFADAGSYCGALTLEGLTGWRLPTRLELISIVNYGREYPSVDTTIFTLPDASGASAFWANNKSPLTASNYLVVLFLMGASYLDGDDKLNFNYVRCVLGPPNTFAGTLTGNGVTVTDTRTGLTWQKADDGMGKSWLAALDYCENLNLGGFTDWRLPSIKELLTIIDDTATMFPFQYPVFDLVGDLWSSTPDAFDGTTVWSLDVANNAGPVGFAPSGKKNARCVRGP